MKKATFILIVSSIFLYACKKSVDQTELPEFKAYVGTSAPYNDTTIFYLTNIGHLRQPSIIKPPKHAVYSTLSNDPISGILYKYSPNINFQGTDTVMFKSVGPTLEQTIISTYYIKTRP